MFIVPIHHPGITVKQIMMVDGTEEFCQEFFDDAAIPAENVLGQVDDGWTVATPRLLFHERAAVGGASPYTSGRSAGRAESIGDDLVGLAKARGKADDPLVRRLIGQVEALSIVQGQLAQRAHWAETGSLPGPAGSLVRLYAGTATVERTNIALEIAGDEAVVWDGDADGRFGIAYIKRQSTSQGGQHGDGPQHHQRAHPGHAPAQVRRRSRRGVPRGARQHDAVSRPTTERSKEESG